jgi:hypothetical protein
MAIIDPWQKAGEFQKALKRITDPKLRTAFTEFRDLWIALANRKQFLTPAELDAEIEALGHIYNEWVSEGQDAGGFRRPAAEKAQGQPRPRASNHSLTHSPRPIAAASLPRLWSE